MHSIAVAGHLCLDIAPRLRETPDVTPGHLSEVGPLAITLGGSVANTGGALADLGAEVTPFASVGQDELGSILAAQLNARGFSEPQLCASPVATTSYSLVIEKPGADRAFWHHTGANDQFDGTNVFLDGHGLLHVGYPPLLPRMLNEGGRPLYDLLSRARAAHVTSSLDLAVVDPRSAVGALDWSGILGLALSETDIATPSLDDLTSALQIEEPYSPALVDRLADRMLADGAAVVAISAGHHGLLVKTASAARLREGGAVLAPHAETWSDRTLHVQSRRVVNPVTTNGAGDASTAGLLFALARGATLEQAASLATACSAVVMSGIRPTPSTILSLDSTLAPLFTPGAAA
ncbi:carbohydrate kinase family protein [Salinibacterium sp.]|uniref:carbohydrate kinase family protein n=1 Tax=Salinibacterium sp. TaxID=1915057 RepID=UPI00286B0E74|nr:carbohydrate kinase family protein [Salinibacterium sp.]